MKTLRNTLVTGVIAIAALALPAAGMGASVVPPENSAATQYTEAIPTGGGQKGTGNGGRDNVSPAAVLGAHKAEKLESQGRKGREAAEVVAATAPSPPPAPEPSPTPEPETSPEPARSGAEGKAESRPQAGGHDEQVGLSDEKVAAAAPSQPAVRQVEIPAGSSGLGEVLAQATGSSSSGQLGLLLPLLILAGLAWALAFVWRQRQRTA